MKISQLDNDIYEIENVLSADNWKKVYAELNPVYNNWIFKKICQKNPEEVSRIKRGG